MSDARELLEWITVQSPNIENPLTTITGYHAFQRLLTDILDRIERLEGQR